MHFFSRVTSSLAAVENFIMSDLFDLWDGLGVLNPTEAIKQVSIARQTATFFI